MPAPANTIKLKRSTRLLVVCGSILFALMLGEVALRIAGYTYPVFYTTDNARGYALRPCMQGWYRKEGEAYVSINCQGLRDREHAFQKPPNTLRIAVVGDSYAEALQVPVEDAFWAVLERRLQACPALGARKVEVINFGVSGYGTAQELITLEQQVWAYQPDVVLLAVTTNNDITDNVRALKKTDEIPYFILRDGQLTLDDSFRTNRAFRLRNSWLNRAGRWLRDSLRVIQAIHQTQHALKARLDAHRARTAQTAQPARPNAAAQPAAQQGAADPNGGATGEELGADNLVYRQPRDEVWQDAWRVTEALVVRMRDEVQSHGAQFVVVTLSNGIQIYPDRTAREAFAARLGVPDLLYPDTRIHMLCTRENIPVLTLAPQLQLYADEHKVFLHGFGHDLGNGHWNQTGHHLAGELIAQQLCAALLH
ncbi:MAG TPA: SGNH/GDSL hydrolase family protein [Pyrinomonadaceae bacterium]|jgi:lysophospholipase L1-like esterase